MICYTHKHLTQLAHTCINVLFPWIDLKMLCSSLRNIEAGDWAEHNSL